MATEEVMVVNSLKDLKPTKTEKSQAPHGWRWSAYKRRRHSRRMLAIFEKRRKRQAVEAFMAGKMPPKKKRAPWGSKTRRGRAVKPAKSWTFPQSPVTATGSVLDEAREIIYGDREKTYGTPDKNLKLIATYWTAHINARFGTDVLLTPDDVCIMMVELKAARLANDPKHRDSQVDAVGYFALMERVQLNGGKHA